MSREWCPNCGVEDTEFVQFGGADNSTTIAEMSEVDGKLLELRYCNQCGVSYENILTVEYRHISHRPDE